MSLSGLWTYDYEKTARVTVSWDYSTIVIIMLLLGSFVKLLQVQLAHLLVYQYVRPEGTGQGLHMSMYFLNVEILYPLRECKN